MKKMMKIGASRKVVTVASGDLVETSYLGAEPGLPAVFTAAAPDLSPAEWLAANKQRVLASLAEAGGVLFRGFSSRSLKDFEACALALSGHLLDYSYRSTPRKEVEGKVYTSTEYPADHSIPMHNEMSYTSQWPMKLWFTCAVAAETGGETPIADSRRVYRALDPEVREEFERRGVMYTRNYGGGVDLPWQEVFQTDDRGRVAERCRLLGIDFDWKEGDQLTTRQTLPAVARHPESGETVWFNQAHLFHVSSLPQEARDRLVREYGEEGLSRNTYFGDGEPLPEDALDHIRSVYEAESVVFPWREGDILVLDNMLAAHGRRPFSGDRRVLVAMAEAYPPEGGTVTPPREVR